MSAHKVFIYYFISDGEEYSLEIVSGDVILSSSTKKRQTSVPEGLVSVNPQIMGGIEVIRGTRIPTYLIKELWDGGLSVDDIISVHYPWLIDEQVRAAIDHEQSKEYYVSTSEEAFTYVYAESY